MKNITIIFSFLFCACSMNSSRKPANSLKTIFDIVDEISDIVNTKLSSSKQCYELLNKTYVNILSTSVNTSELKNISLVELTEKSQKVFDLRNKIQSRLKELSYENSYYNECLDEVKHTLLALRYIDDFLVEEYYSRNQKFKKKKLTGHAPQLLVNPSFVEFKDYSDLQSGDILLSRASAFGSAAIARVAKRDYQFSHLALVHRIGNKIYTIEAHIELGLKIAPINTYLKSDNARVLVFRYSDKNIAKSASEKMYLHTKSILKKKKTIDYDFAMDYSDHSNYFCSEVIHHAYQMATDGELSVPFFKSHVNKGIVPFLKNMGLAIDENNYESFDLFAPADMQVDSRFQVVAEWRNPSQLEEIRFKDSILSKLYTLMENENYSIDLNENIQKSVNTIRFVRDTFPLSLLVYKKLPRKMNKQALGTFIALDKIGGSFYDRLVKETKLKGNKLDFIEIDKVIDQHYIEDLNVWKNGPNPKKTFHYYFHP